MKDDILTYLGIGITALIMGYVLIQFFSLASVGRQVVGSAGEISASEGLQLFLYENQTEEVTTVWWGVLEPDDTVNRTVYIVNRSYSLAKLNMTTENWQPSNASDYITLVWDVEGEVLERSEMIAATLTLHISPDISGITNFSFDIIINR